MVDCIASRCELPFEGPYSFQIVARLLLVFRRTRNSLYQTLELLLLKFRIILPLVLGVIWLVAAGVSKV